jgi:uncharacterized protein (AIM24 family)
MLASSPNIKVEGSLKGGLLGGLARKFLRGETLFFLTLTARTSRARCSWPRPLPARCG